MSSNSEHFVEPDGELVFTLASAPGFGDRYNTWAWSMRWWQGHLYVGTNRAFLCAERAALSMNLPLLARLPFVKYPPEDPDAGCPSQIQDLPLQGEIWRWTPPAGQAIGSLVGEWERVFQSPCDVPIPGQPGRYVARDIGFRDLVPFTEPDGTTALYASGVNSRFIYRQVPSSRLLRTVDGIAWQAVPQDAGTVMGDLDKATLRTIVAYEGRLFVIAGVINGDGVLLEARDPAAGNSAFRQVSPPGMRVFEMAVFNGFLYLGLRDPRRGYAVVKTNARGAPPYTFTPVVSDGAHLSPKPSLSVISMGVFRDHLYVGTDRPAELIRIAPDDSWELLVGTPRRTPSGWKRPLSGLDAGFHNWLNGHLWRREEYGGRLYVGTMKMSTHLRTIPEAERVLTPNFGCDLYATDDGVHFYPVVPPGFGDRFNFGARTLEGTPYGLFVGTANSWYGLQIWRGTPRAATMEAPPEAPHNLRVQVREGRALLEWEPSPRASRYCVQRAPVRDERRAIEANPFLARVLAAARAWLRRRGDVYLPPLPDQVWIPGTYGELGASEACTFVDPSIAAGERYLYYVQAEDARGQRSRPSNLAAAPSLAAADELGNE